MFRFAFGRSSLSWFISHGVLVVLVRGVFGRRIETCEIEWNTLTYEDQRPRHAFTSDEALRPTERRIDERAVGFVFSFEFSLDIVSIAIGKHA